MVSNWEPLVLDEPILASAEEGGAKKLRFVTKEDPTLLT